MPITGFVSCSLGIAVPSTLDSTTLAWVAAVIANGGTVSLNRRTIVNNLIVGLKIDGIWAKLDRLWIHAAENTQSALTDMVALTLAVANGSPAFAANLGYTGVDSSTTVYISTGVNLLTFSGAFGANAGHISAWSNTDTTSSVTGGCIIGSSRGNGGSGLVEIFPLFFSGNAFWNCNGSGIALAETHSLGHYIANRSDSNNEQAYLNGSNVGNNTPSPPSGLANVPIIILACNDETVGINFGSACQVTMVSIGGSLSTTDATNFYNRLRTYMTAVGVP
jgi:hypothetical protein